MRYWLTPSDDAAFDDKVQDICSVYRDAPQLAQQGERIVSTDELTGVQALERKHPGLPMVPGKVERREFEYIRHGTCSFILSRDVVTGQILAPPGAPTRTEADFLAHVQGVVATDPSATRWHFVVDNLNIHRSESLVRWVADESDLDLALGREGQARDLAHAAQPGGLPERPDPSDRLSLHAQALLLAQPDRDLAEYPGAQAAQTRLVHLGRRPAGQGAYAFIAYYNRTMAKPFKWTYQGKPLVA